MFDWCKAVCHTSRGIGEWGLGWMGIWRNHPFSSIRILTIATVLNIAWNTPRWCCINAWMLFIFLVIFKMDYNDVSLFLHTWHRTGGLRAVRWGRCGGGSRGLASHWEFFNFFGRRINRIAGTRRWGRTRIWRDRDSSTPTWNFSLKAADH